MIPLIDPSSVHSSSSSSSSSSSGMDAARMITNSTTTDDNKYTEYLREGFVGCHGPGNVSDAIHFYGNDTTNIPMPELLEGCDDDFAMVEFDQVVRIYFSFRSFAYEDGVHDTYKVLGGLNAKDVDILVFNDQYDEPNTPSYIVKNENEDPSMLYRKEVWQNRFHLESIYDFMPLQQQDIGRWWGADNPGMNVVPDEHACMPGVPDDTSSLLLFSILTQSKLTRD